MDGDNSLDGAAVQDFNELSEVGSGENVEILVFVDRRNSSAGIYRVEKGISLDEATPLVDEGEANMGAPETLKRFVSYAVSNFPADRLALIFWNHGDGWRSIKWNKKPKRAVSWDEDNGNGTEDPLFMWEVVSALKDLEDQGINFDLIGFDECLEGMVEVGIDLENFTDVLVFSELTEPYDGWNYTTILSSLSSGNITTPYSLGKLIVDSYYSSYSSYSGNYVLASVNSTAIDVLREKIDDFAISYLSLSDEDRDSVRQEILNARSSSKEADDGYGNNGENTYVDLKDLFRNIYNSVSDEVLREKALNVIDALDLYVRTIGDSYSGLSIYFPKEGSSYEPEYGFSVPSYSYYYGQNYYNPASSKWSWDEFLEDVLQVGN